MCTVLFKICKSNISKALVLTGGFWVIIHQNVIHSISMGFKTRMHIASQLQ